MVINIKLVDKTETIRFVQDWLWTKWWVDILMQLQFHVTVCVFLRRMKQTMKHFCVVVKKKILNNKIIPVAAYGQNKG